MPDESLQTGRAPHAGDLRTAFAESDYLLSRWEFCATGTGDLIFRARRNACSVATLAGLLMLLRQAADRSFPRTVVFNFQHCKLEGEEWTGVRGLLEDFVTALDGKLLILPGQHARQIYVCDRRTCREREHH